MLDLTGKGLYNRAMKRLIDCLNAWKSARGLQSVSMAFKWWEHHFGWIASVHLFN